MSEYEILPLILPRSEVEKLVEAFVDEKQLYATYGKDAKGVFRVNFIVKEETE